jgi:hypothetical protein
MQNIEIINENKYRLAYEKKMFELNPLPKIYKIYILKIYFRIFANLKFQRQRLTRN